MGKNKKESLGEAGIFYIGEDGIVAKNKATEGMAIYEYDRDLAMIIVEKVSDSEAQHDAILKRAEATLENRTGENAMANQAKEAPVISAKDGKIVILLGKGWLTEKQAEALDTFLATALSGKELSYKIYKNGRVKKIELESTPQSKPKSKPPTSEEPQDEPPAQEPPASEEPQDEPPAQEPPASEEPQSEPPASEETQDEPPASEETQDELKYYEKPIDHEGIRKMIRDAVGLPEE